MYGYKKNLAGAVGFEPTHGGTKTRCLTAWLRPKKICLKPSAIFFKMQEEYYFLNFSCED